MQNQRVIELVRALSEAAKRGALFYNFDRALETDAAARMGTYAADLKSLDDTAWAALKGEAVKRFARLQREDVGALFDLLNEAKGYRYLADLGCRDIAFVARDYDRKSPDLSATLDGRAVLCEVKTVEISGAAPETFFAEKLTKIMSEAVAQLGPGKQRKIVYVVLRAGTRTPQNIADTKARLDQCLAAAPFPDVEIKTCVGI